MQIQPIITNGAALTCFLTTNSIKMLRNNAGKTIDILYGSVNKSWRCETSVISLSCSARKAIKKPPRVSSQPEPAKNPPNTGYGKNRAKCARRNVPTSVNNKPVSKLVAPHIANAVATPASGFAATTTTPPSKPAIIDMPVL